MKFTATLIFLLLFLLPSRAQFFLNGDAIQVNDTCFQLTEPVNWQSGSIWNPEKINLNQSFEVVMRIFLGCKDADGADGIVFGFQPISTSIGSQGGGIGFSGIVPSLGIEFDTYQNANLNDPFFDHIAVIRNGDLNHFNNNTLAGPTFASEDGPDIEDCREHDIRVSWDADARTLRIYLDCSLRLTYSGDIVNEIFGGDPFVFWGFTSATGGLNNRQTVCFRYTTFIDQLEDVVICPGGKYQLTARGGTSYRWTPAAGLSNPDIPNPIARPDTTTTYLVEIQDGCGNPFQDDIVVTVAGDSVFFDLGPDTTICEDRPLLLDASSGTATYQWSDGSTAPTLLVDQSGAYRVTVTRTDTICVASDWVDIDVIPLTQADLGSDTTLCQEQKLLLRATDPNADTYRWQNGAAADTFLVDRPGRYEVSVGNQCGEAVDAIEVTYEDCRQAYIPNAFSPNFDGLNDRFQVYADSDVAQVAVMRIFNRWGGLVYEAEAIDVQDPRHGWDGAARGDPQPAGLYLYYLEIVFRDGFREVVTGEVTLLR